MKKTTAHKTLSAICQLLCLLYILETIFTILSGYLNKILFDAESEIMKYYIITYYSFGVYIMSVNILIALLGGCISSSGSKYLMGIFNKIYLLTLLCSITLTFYFKEFYQNNFINELLNNQKSFNFVKILISNHFGQINDVKVNLLINQHLTNVINKFLINQICFFVMIITVTLIFKKMRNLKLYIEDSKLPKIKEITRKGLNTNALSQRRVIDVII